MTEKKMNFCRPFVDVDLHGCHQDEAVKKIEKALKQVTAGTYQIRLIHGFNHGKTLMHMIRDEYRYDQRVRRIMPGSNPGVTVLVIREL